MIHICDSCGEAESDKLEVCEIFKPSDPFHEFDTGPAFLCRPCLRKDECDSVKEGAADYNMALINLLSAFNNT
jgi:hypothetical protein